MRHDVFRLKRIDGSLRAKIANNEVKSLVNKKPTQMSGLIFGGPYGIRTEIIFY
jgi:hypothetical protein